MNLDTIEMDRYLVCLLAFVLMLFVSFMFEDIDSGYFLLIFFATKELFGK